MPADDWWPHVFTKSGPEVQIGEEDFLDNMKRPIMAQPMECVHCHLKYTRNKDPMPDAGPCPVRNTKRETKRILNKR